MRSSRSPSKRRTPFSTSPTRPRTGALRRSAQLLLRGVPSAQRATHPQRRTQHRSASHPPARRARCPCTCWRPEFSRRTAIRDALFLTRLISNRRTSPTATAKATSKPTTPAGQPVSPLFLSLVPRPFPRAARDAFSMYYRILTGLKITYPRRSLAALRLPITPCSCLAQAVLTTSCLLRRAAARRLGDGLARCIVGKRSRRQTDTPAVRVASREWRACACDACGRGG